MKSMQMKCVLCTRAQRRYGKQDFTKTCEKFPNKSPMLGCPNCESKDNGNEHKHGCSFCVKTFSTATRLYLHTSQRHELDDIHDSEWDFYSVVANSILGNLEFFYYDQGKLDRLSNLIGALQITVNQKRRLATIPE